MKTIVVIDGQGGGLGRQYIEKLRRLGHTHFILAVGTNAQATAAMLKAGADAAATGENAVIYNAARADLIVGPMALILDNALYGEISPPMARAVAGSDATKLLIPFNRCNAVIVGVEERPLADYVEEAVRRTAEFLQETAGE